MDKKPTTLQSFIRSQIGSSLATATDFIVFFLAKDLFGIYYAIASYLGNIAGAIVSFLLGRNWAFKNKEGKISNQALKYIITSGMSSILNTGILILLVEYTGIQPFYGKVIVSLIIGLSFNFFMYKYFVFK